MRRIEEGLADFFFIPKILLFVLVDIIISFFMGDEDDD